jgi:glycosyltransferase involved in cell wall biosynthesis
MEVTLFGKHKGSHGPTRVTRGLASGLAGAGHRVKVLGYGDRADSPAPGVDLELLGEMPASVRGWWRLYRTVRRRVNGQDADVFHAVERYPFAADVRTVLWTSDMFVMWQRTGTRPPVRAFAGELLINWMSRRGVKNAGVVVAESPETVRQMKRLWRTDADRTIPLGIEAEFLAEPTAVDEPPRVLLVGRLDRRKGQQRLLDHLSPNDERFELRLAGGIKDDEYADQVLAEWSDNYLGYLSESDLEEAYESADIVVVPSHLENFSMVGLEAMAKGCALVITEDCGLAQFGWANEDAGVFVATDGPDAASLLEHLSTSDSLDSYQRLAYGQAEQLTWERIADQYVDVYGTATEGRVKPTTE